MSPRKSAHPPQWQKGELCGPFRILHQNAFEKDWRRRRGASRLKRREKVNTLLFGGGREIDTIKKSCEAQKNAETGNPNAQPE